MKTITIQNGDAQTVFLDTLEDCCFRVGANATLQVAGVFRKGWGGKPKISIEPKEGSVSIFSFVFIGKKEDCYSFEIESFHQEVSATTHVFMRSVLKEKARLDCTGRLHIAPVARKSDVFLSHHSLVLSQSAYSHTTPALEIETNDVKAGHAVTVGHVDEEILFYLNSRGFDTQEATTLLVNGFIAGDVSRLASQELRSRMQLEFEHALLERE